MRSFVAILLVGIGVAALELWKGPEWEPLQIVAAAYVIVVPLFLAVARSGAARIAALLALGTFAVTASLFLLDLAGDGSATTVTSPRARASLVRPPTGLVDAEENFVVRYRHVTRSQEVWIIARTEAGLYFPYIPECPNKGQTVVRRPNHRSTGSWEHALPIGDPERDRGAKFTLLVAITGPRGTSALTRLVRNWCTSGYLGFSTLPRTVRITSTTIVVRA